MSGGGGGAGYGESCKRKLMRGRENSLVTSDVLSFGYRGQSKNGRQWEIQPEKQTEGATQRTMMSLFVTKTTTLRNVIERCGQYSS